MAKQCCLYSAAVAYLTSSFFCFTWKLSLFCIPSLIIYGWVVSFSWNCATLCCITLFRPLTAYLLLGPRAVGLGGISRCCLIPLPYRGRIDIAANRHLSNLFLTLSNVHNFTAFLGNSFSLFSSIHVLWIFLGFLQLPERGLEIFSLVPVSCQFCTLSTDNIWRHTFKVFKQATKVYSVSKILLWRRAMSLECCFSTQPEADKRCPGYHHVLFWCLCLEVQDLVIT